MIKKFFRWLKWLKNSKPYLSYEGFHCGCCGAWEDKNFKVPEYKSAGQWGDTWGLCKKCISDSEGQNENKQLQRRSK